MIRRIATQIDDTVGLISPEQDVCIVQGDYVRCIPEVQDQNHHICVTQQVNRDYLTKFETQKL